MFQRMNRMLDKVSEYLAPRKGLLPLIGIFFIIVNFILQFLPMGLAEGFKSIFTSRTGSCNIWSDARLGVIIRRMFRAPPP